MGKEKKQMSNSPLVTVNVPASTSNYTKGRTKKISEITIHHMAGVMTAAQCGAIFAKAGRNASSHYGIGNDGSVGLYVDESNTAWCNSNWNANCRAVTIETSNNATGGDWTVSDTALAKLIELVADIAKRNGITLEVGKTLTWHSMYSATTCPGNYLRSKMQYICDEANKIINGGSSSSGSSTSSSTTTDEDNKLDVDGSFGPATVKRSQEYFGTTQDGVVSSQPKANYDYCYSCHNIAWEFVETKEAYGSQMIEAMQKWLGVSQDGYFGKQTITALQNKLGVDADGSCGPATVRAWQTYLNNH